MATQRLSHTMRVLEFDKVLQLLTQHARTSGGKLACEQLVPETTLIQAQKALGQTTAAESELYRIGSSPVGSFADVADPLQRAALGGVLSPRNLLDIASLLSIARASQQSLCPDLPESHPQRQSPLRAQATQLRPHRSLEEDIHRAILGEDEIADAASPQLASIRQSMRRVQSQVRDKLDSYLHSTSMQSHLQDTIITQRSGRFVLPVKSTSRASVPGIVHDQSSSGSTVFIEPMAIVQLNNTLRGLQADEREEIERILYEFSARVAMIREDLLLNQGILFDLDFAFAKGELSRQMRAFPPTLNDCARLNFEKARHPLLDANTVIPVDVYVGDDFSTLVITGPNTGGKTVCLKTVGLLSMMAASGLHLPAASGTVAAVFPQIFADIGDEQSIEQSLSTFSGHISNIVSLMRDVTPGSLVLLDELGAGTDPTEGAALAIAMLEQLQTKGAVTVATTHYAEVKAYALTQEGVENASMAFDVATLRPTFRLSIGIPGSSNAFAIATRLGMEGGIIDRAQALLSVEQVKFEEVILSAQQQQQVATAEREDARLLREEAITLREAAAEEHRKLEQKKKELLIEARAQAKRILAQAKEQADKSIAAAQRAKANVTTESLKAAQDEQKALRDAHTALGAEPEHVVQEEALTSVTLGQPVRVMGTTTVGTVLAYPDGRGNVAIQAGQMKMMVKLTKLTAAKAPKSTVGQRQTRTVPIKKQSPNTDLRAPGLSVDLRGMMQDEALMTVDRFLDQAILSGLAEVMIVHGKGTGALRQAVRAHLRTINMVKSHRPGNFGEGDAGVTVVQLK